MFCSGRPLIDERYRRQIRPTRNPNPRASAMADSGRSRTASSSESPSDAACDWAVLATTPSRSDASATMEPILARACFNTPPRLLLRHRPDVARGVRDLVRKTPDRISHVRHLLFQASKGVVISCVSRFVASFSVGRKIRCHPFLRNTTVCNVGARGRFRSSGASAILVHIQTLPQDQRHHQNWR